MDTSALETAGFKPIKPTLDAIAAAKTTDDIVKAFGSRAGGGGGGGGGRGGGGGLAPFALGPQTDPKNSKMVILSANQGGLIAQPRGLPRHERSRGRSAAPTTSTT